MLVANRQALEIHPTFFENWGSVSMVRFFNKKRQLFSTKKPSSSGKHESFFFLDEKH